MNEAPSVSHGGGFPFAAYAGVTARFYSAESSVSMKRPMARNFA